MYCVVNYLHLMVWDCAANPKTAMLCARSQGLPIISGRPLGIFLSLLAKPVQSLHVTSMCWSIPISIREVFLAPVGNFRHHQRLRCIWHGCVPHQPIWLAWPPFEVDSTPLFVGDSSTCLSSDHQNNFYMAHSRVSSGNLASSGRSVAREGELKTVYHDSPTKWIKWLLWGTVYPQNGVFLSEYTMIEGSLEV